MGLSKKKFNIFGIRFVGGRVHEKLINRRELPKKVMGGGGGWTVYKFKERLSKKERGCL